MTETTIRSAAAPTNSHQTRNVETTPHPRSDSAIQIHPGFVASKTPLSLWSNLAWVRLDLGKIGVALPHRAWGIGVRFVKESLRRFQNVCRSGLNFIYGYWGETQWLITTLCRCGLVFLGNDSSTNVCQKNIKHELYHLAAVLHNVTARSLILHLNTFYSENYWDTVLRLLPWWVWECLFCGIYALEKFYHNTHTLYGPSYASVNTSCHKILDHIVHRETLCFCC